MKTKPATPLPALPHDMNPELREMARKAQAYPALVEALRFIEQKSNSLPQLWEKSLDSPERKHNDARNAILGNARDLLRSLGEL